MPPAVEPFKNCVDEPEEIHELRKLRNIKLQIFQNTLHQEYGGFYHKCTA